MFVYLLVSSQGCKIVSVRWIIVNEKALKKNVFEISEGVSSLESSLLFRDDFFFECLDYMISILNVFETKVMKAYDKMIWLPISLLANIESMN